LAVTVPPRSKHAPDNGDLAERVAALEALIEEARRRARRRRLLYAAVVLAAIAAGVAASFGLGGNDKQPLLGSGVPQPSAAPSTPGRWLPSRGPYGGGLTIAVDHSDPNVLYAGGWGTVFKSTDGGGSWKGVTNEPWNRVDSIAVDATQPRVVYAGTDRGVAKTADGGRTWRMMNNGLDEYLPGHRHGEGIYSLVIDARHPQTVFANSDGAFVKTTDGGAHWRIIGPEPYRSESCPRCAVTMHGYESTAAIDPNHAETIYAGWTGHGRTQLYASVDGGSSWRRIQAHGLPSGGLDSLVIDTSSGSLYGTSSTPGAYKSVDGGRTWSSAGLTGQTPWSLAVNAGVVYASTNASLLGSTDGGATWQPVGTGANLPASDIVSGARGVLYGIGDGVVKSVDGGQTWSLADNGLVSTSISSLVLQPGSSKILYAGGDGGVFTSTNAGGAWRRASRAMGDSAVVGLAVDPHDLRTVYAATMWSGLYKSTDAGVSWEPVAMARPAKSFGAVAVDPRDSSTVYAGASSSVLSAHGTLLKTDDGGVTWRVLAGVPWAVQSLAIDPSAPRTVFAGTNHGLYRTRDGGTTWRRVVTASAAPNGVYSSFTFGFAFVAVAIDPHNPRNVYAGIRSHGILRSTDGGDTWKAADNGLTDVHVTTLGIDPRDPRVIYASTLDGGVLRSADAARSWRPFGVGLHSADTVTAFAIGPTGRAVYAATQGDGVVRLGP
jgi:photosystem II stability/assembly factor-like uncharacterized protein